MWERGRKKTACLRDCLLFSLLLNPAEIPVSARLFLTLGHAPGFHNVFFFCFLSSHPRRCLQRVFRDPSPPTDEHRAPRVRS